MESDISALLGKMRRNAAIGLIGSFVAAAIVIVFYYASPYRFYMEQRVASVLMLAGMTLSVIVIASALLTVNRRPRRLRQLDDVQERLKGYVSMVSSISLFMLVSNIILCGIILITHDNTLLMLVIIGTLLLVLGYPNMYRLKADIGLTHEQMRDIFGDAYMGEEAALQPNDADSKEPGAQDDSPRQE